MKIKYLLIGIFICILSFSMLIPNSLAQNETVTNETVINETDLTDDSWHDTHWGGDTGNDTFVEPDAPINPPDEPSGDICTGTYCTSGSIVCFIGVAFVVSKRNGVNHEKYEKNEHENEE